MVEKDYEIKIWEKAIEIEEQELTRMAPTYAQRREGKETVEEFILRVRAEQDRVLERLEYARDKKRTLVEELNQSNKK